MNERTKKIAKALRDANLASPLIRNTGHKTMDCSGNLRAYHIRMHSNTN